VFLRRITAAAASIASCSSRDSSSSHQSQKQDNAKATQDDDKDAQEGFGFSNPNPVKTTTTYAIFHPAAICTHLPLADATPVIQYQHNELRLVQNQLQNQLERREEKIAQVGANIKKIDQDIRERTNI
jgi:hypothetical protein